MRAAIMRDRKIVVDEIPALEPGPGQVLVKTLACGICGSDLHVLKFAHRMLEVSQRSGQPSPMDLDRDIVMGHEFCAEILDHGPATQKTLKAGTRVCSVPVTIGPGGLESVGYSNTYPGGYAEQMLLSEMMLLEVPSGLPTEHAALTEPMAVGLHAVEKARLQADDLPLVIGCGPVGLSVIAALKLRGVGPVIAADFSPKRRELAEGMGADIVIDPGESSPYARWRDVATPEGAQSDSPLAVLGLGSLRRPGVIFECVGVPGVLQQILAFVEKEIQFLEEDPALRFGRTDAKQEIQTTDASLYVMGHRSHVFIDSFKAFGHEQKMTSTYMNKQLVHEDDRVHPRFSPILKTGRTSCAGPNIQNVPRKDGIRGMYCSPPGWLFYAADYGQLELCALAQSCLVWQGFSKMAEILNSGQDLHRWFAAVVLGKNIEDITKEERQIAKACNFGFPGGLGLKKFQYIARNSYDVELELGECKRLKQVWVDSFPEMEQHFRPPIDHSFSNKETGEDRYVGRTITGRIRRNSPYCAACNYVFQGLAADGAKLALWFLFQEQYRMVNFIHDEVITELREDEYLQHHVQRINHLMTIGMQQVIPDVKITVEGTLSRRWYKEAEPVFSDSGDLLVWEPKLIGE